MRLVVPLVDSAIALVFVSMVVELLPIASVFWRIAVTVEQPVVAMSARSATTLSMLGIDILVTIRKP
jgi:hypothetical protein